MQEVSQLHCAIAFGAGDLRGCRAALDALAVDAADPTAAAANLGCVLYREGRYAEAQEQFAMAAQVVQEGSNGGSGGYYCPELVYAVAACQYRQGQLAAALGTLAGVVEAGVHLHPELGIGTQTEGMQVGQCALDVCWVREVGIWGWEQCLIACGVWGLLGSRGRLRPCLRCRRAAWATARACAAPLWWTPSTCGPRWSFGWATRQVRHHYGLPYPAPALHPQDVQNLAFAHNATLTTPSDPSKPSPHTVLAQAPPQRSAICRPGRSTSSTR